MKPFRLLAFGMGLLVAHAALATDRVGSPNSPDVNVVLPSPDDGYFPQPAVVANRVAIVGLHVVAAAGIALSVMTRRRRAGR